MPFDRTSGNHRFDFSSGVCLKCGMTREHYQDNGKPTCRGKPEDQPNRQFAIED